MTEETKNTEKKNNEAITCNEEVKGLSLNSTKIQKEDPSETTIHEGQLELVQENHKLKERLKELEGQYLRSVADYQNLQKRSLAEKEDLYKYASQKTIEILLPALDTFDYAKQAVKPDSKIEKVTEDFNLVFEMLLKCLKDIGLDSIEETGIPFNPVYHEPLHQVPTNELPDHTVMQVLKKGYMLNKKVIRPALVAVSVKEEKKEGD